MTQSREESALMIDVRELHEFEKEHIAGAISLPLGELTSAKLPPGKTAILYCGAGKRSCAAAEQLIEAGYRDVATVEGGLSNWKAAGLPTIAAEIGPISTPQST